MIYAIGLDSDSTFIHFLREGLRRDVKIQPVNLRAVILDGDWRLAVPDNGDSFVSALGERIPLDPQSSYFCRIIDLSTVQQDLKMAGLWRNLVVGLSAWLEHIPGTVINRPGAHAHNFSKPLHEAFLWRAGFRVPMSITSSDKKQLLRFFYEGPTIVKPVSGIRATTRLVEPGELEQFNIAQGPIHLQRYVRGADVRAHVVGETVHAELIKGDAVDYRGGNHYREFSPHDLPDHLVRMVVETTASMGLLLAGWDFKYGADREYWCLEANPMPGYDGYDRRLGGRITEALLALLAL